MTARIYRADVDGLRAVAIVLVVLFHATNRCPGGFVGVDVFFVISGFLITGLLLEEEQRGGIRVVDFWLRRIRRLLPAAAVMVLATLLVGFALMMPGDYAELGASAIAQQLLVSNIFFAGKTGYFAGSADLKPLLHTWSLAVEEQFYLGYPLLLVLLRRVPRRGMVAVLVALAAASFAASDAGARAGSQAAFYLLPPRAWEILLGGLVCFAPLPRRRPAWIAELLAAVGIAGILLAASRFDRATPFPGRAALLPCAATALVIHANAAATTRVGRLLAARPVVFLGLISYSLYLWHWPVLSFLRHLSCDAPPGKAAKAVALLVSVVVAALSWRYVEQPFRRKELLPRPRELCIAAGVAVALLLAGAGAIVGGGGLPARLGPQAAAYAAAADRGARLRQTVTIDTVRAGSLPVCGATDGPRSCLVWGDSHAVALLPGIDAACRARGFRCLSATAHATAPLLDYVVRHSSGLNARGPEYARAVVERAKAARVDVVFIAGYWHWYDDLPEFAECLRRTVRELADAGIPVVIVRDVARFPYSPPLKLFMATRLGADVTKIGVTDAAYARDNDPCNGIIDRLAGDGVSVLDLAPAFVDEAGLWRAEYDGVAIYGDSNHLSLAGSLRARPVFEAMLERLSTAR